MPCTFSSDAEKNGFLWALVKGSILEVHGESRIVTEHTFLGPGGLGHGAAKRRRYFRVLKRRLEDDGRGCTLTGLSAASFSAAEITQVGHVLKLVKDHLG